MLSHVCSLNASGANCFDPQLSVMVSNWFCFGLGVVWVLVSFLFLVLVLVLVVVFVLVLVLV